MHEFSRESPGSCLQASLHSSAARAVPHRQDRIDSRGGWWSGTHPASQQQQQQQQPYVIGSSAGRGDTAPNSPPVSDAAIDQLADLLQSARGALVLTGAGCSTESGVPDYRCAACCMRWPEAMQLAVREPAAAALGGAGAIPLCRAAAICLLQLLRAAPSAGACCALCCAGDPQAPTRSAPLSPSDLSHGASGC